MNGRKFRIIKFRTMRQVDSLDPNSHWTVANDAYITPLGRWLRRTNLDEIPQFFNVLRGEMSVVGPRPERPFFLEQFRRLVPEYMARYYVKSGITGWAQVNGWRGDTPIPQRVAHDESNGLDAAAAPDGAAARNHGPDGTLPEHVAGRVHGPRRARACLDDGSAAAHDQARA